MKVIMGLLVAVFVLYVVVDVGGSLVNKSEYKAYEGRTDGTVLSHESITITNKTMSHDEYTYVYEYKVDGKTYEGKSSYIREHVDSGTSIEVCYDLNEPSRSVLSMENDEANGTLIAWALVAIIIGGCYVFASRD